MRFLGEIENSDDTTRLVAWLLTKGIKVKVEPTAEPQAGYEVWVKDEDFLDEAKTEYSEFLANPAAEKYTEAIRQADTIAREEALKRKRLQKNVVKVQGGQVHRHPPLTVMLIVICAIVFLTTNLGKPPHDGPVQQALQFVSVEPPVAQQVVNEAKGDPDSLSLRLASLQRGELWRIVTPMFIHYGVFHILFNMMWLHQFGKMIENRYGTASLGVLVLVVAAISNLVQCTVPEAIGGSAPYLTANSHLITALGGMSGVVYGLFGFVWIRSIVDRSSGMFVQQSTVMILMVWLFFCMTPVSTGMIGSSVANWAHGIGLLVGMAAGYWPALKK